MIVAGTFKVPPRNVERFRPYMRAMVEATRNELGCRLYRHVADPDERGVFHVIEAWATRGVVEAHRRSQSQRDWRASCGLFGVQSSRSRLYNFPRGWKSVLAIATDRDAGSLLVAYSRDGFATRFVVACLDHESERMYALKSDARAGLAHAREWCDGCRRASIPEGVTVAAVVTAVFDATGVPEP